MTAALVSAQGVSKLFRSGGEEIVAVRDVTCAVLPAARVALFGPSGSGKSTLLQLLGGLDAPSAGAVAWPAFGDGSTIRPRHIAFVFQNQTLLPALTVLENVEVPLLLSGIEESTARSRARESLTRLHLDGFAQKLPEELSGGQAQRVAFARALVSRPQLILADEPTGQLDRETASHLFEAVLPWCEEIGAALVIATHDPTVGERMQERWSMRFGVLERQAS